MAGASSEDSEKLPALRTFALLPHRLPEDLRVWGWNPGTEGGRAEVETVPAQ